MPPTPPPPPPPRNIASYPANVGQRCANVAADRFRMHTSDGPTMARLLGTHRNGRRACKSQPAAITGDEPEPSSQRWKRPGVPVWRSGVGSAGDVVSGKSLTRTLANTLTQGLEKIPDQLGYLVMSDDGVLASGGELENAERAGKVLVAMLRLAVTLTIEDKAEPCFKRLSVMFEDHSYLLTVSGQKIFVVKRKRSSSCPKEA
ncbi:unnamed protein product [Lampetra fluviatilis]